MLKLNQKGQALLIVVLVMVVALTVGLSIASKTIISLRTSTEEANSQKALAAAEAGIEQALKTNQIASGTFTDNQSSYQPKCPHLVLYPVANGQPPYSLAKVMNKDGQGNNQHSIE